MLWIINIITLSTLAIFSLVYLSSGLKAPAVEKAMVFLRPHVDNLAVVGVIFGLIAACSMPLLIGIPKYMFIYLFANVVLVLLALPYMLHRFEKKLENKTNAAILGEIRGSLSFITSNEKIFGLVGAGAAAGIIVAPLI